MKKVILTIIGILIIFELLFFSGKVAKTYARYKANASVDDVVYIAKPVVENTVEQLIVPLSSMRPGNSFTYSFSVTNENDSNEITEVTMDYVISIVQSNYVPLNITLKKDGVNTNILTNGVSPIYTLPHTVSTTNTFELIVSWDSEDAYYHYANLIETLRIDITATQKVQG